VGIKHFSFKNLRFFLSNLLSGEIMYLFDREIYIFLLKTKQTKFLKKKINVLCAAVLFQPLLVFIWNEI